jgi:hypothetical protein
LLRVGTNSRSISRLQTLSTTFQRFGNQLQSGLPTNVRDAGLAIPGLKEVIPINPANREWMQQQAEKRVRCVRSVARDHTIITDGCW